MKKSELRKYIRETIINELSPADITAQKSAQVAANKSIQDLTAKVASTTEPTAKKAATDSLAAAKARLATINTKISQQQPIPADVLPENNKVRNFDDVDDEEGIVESKDSATPSYNGIRAGVTPYTERRKLNYGPIKEVNSSR